MALSFALPRVLKFFGLRNSLLGFAGFGVSMAIATLAWKPLVKRGDSQGKEFEDEVQPSEVSVNPSVNMDCFCVCVFVCVF